MGPGGWTGAEVADTEELDDDNDGAENEDARAETDATATPAAVGGAADVAGSAAAADDDDPKFRPDDAVSRAPRVSPYTVWLLSPAFGMVL